MVFDEQSGGYTLLKGDICGAIKGRGACTNCGYITNLIHWPQAAYIQVTVPGGMVWAWSQDLLSALRARIGGDKVQLRRMLLGNPDLARFVNRIPKAALLTKNRARLLYKLKEFERELSK
ncbi:hypothetical protein UNDKW_2450 [Undibacterium sp. KW1]|nr:hypothetical protein UNDKW_2450 [Undibacterium sp. KW1]